MKITITASDGKEFKGENYELLAREVNAYETELTLRKQQEHEKQKKIEEERKRLEETEKRLLKELNDDYIALAKKVEEFEETTGKKLVYTYNHGTDKYTLKPVRNTLDFAYDNGFQRLLRVLGID